MEIQEQQYIKGFNHGYTLSRYEPGLTTKIIKNLNPANDYLSGFFSGKEEWELEQSRSQLDEIQRLRDNSKDREQDKER